MGILKVFDHEYKELKRFEKIVEEIDALEEEYKKLSDEELEKYEILFEGKKPKEEKKKEEGRPR